MKCSSTKSRSDGKPRSGVIVVGWQFRDGRVESFLNTTRRQLFRVELAPPFCTNRRGIRASSVLRNSVRTMNSSVFCACHRLHLCRRQWFGAYLVSSDNARPLKWLMMLHKGLLRPVDATWEWMISYTLQGSRQKWPQSSLKLVIDSDWSRGHQCDRTDENDNS